jgi:glycosyltransferase involved in cell wall biosynthesis
MRVLYVNQTAQVSGAERSLLALLQGLDNEVEAIVACPDGELAQELAVRGVERHRIVGTGASFRLHPLHTGRGLAEIGRSALQVRCLVGRLNPDLVHANTTRAALLALLARRSRPPVIAHIRDWAPDGRFARFVLGTIARRADRVVANSAYVAGQFDGLPLRAPVRVLHNPVDLSRFDPAVADGVVVRRELGVGPDAVVLSTIAQLTPWKGQDDSVRTLAELLDQKGVGEVVLLLAGSAKFTGGTQFDNVAYERDLRALVETLGLAERVRFLGERSDVPAILAATDVLLLPSWREAFGRIAIEAMAMSVLVAATEVGGPAEIVRDGVDGLLLPPRQPDAWAARLAPLIADAELRREYGERARERAREFRVEVHAATVLNVYRELLAGGRGGDAPL